MSAHANPDIVTDGLAFIYDTGSGKSYKGEPTVNLLNYTTEFNNWTAAKNSGTTPTVTADTSVNPLGLANAPMADKVYLPDDGTYPRIQQYFTPSNTNTHTFSVWIRSLSGNCDCFLGAFRNSPWSLPGSSVKSITGEWQRFTFSWTPPDTTTHVIYMGSHDTAAQKGNTLEFWGAQMEAKSHATQFVNGTRSATQGLLDLTNNATIDISNASFDSNAQMVFDGTDDTINTGLFSGRNPTADPFTIEAMVKSDITSGSRMWIDATSNGSNQRLYCAYAATGTGNPMGIQGTAWSSSGVNDADYHHYVIVMDGSVARLYNNGEAHSTRNYTSYQIQALNIGGRNTYRWLGDIPIFKLYNKALTASEVLQNYNATKGRFQ